MGMECEKGKAVGNLAPDFKNPSAPNSGVSFTNADLLKFHCSIGVQCWTCLDSGSIGSESMVPGAGLEPARL